MALRWSRIEGRLGRDFDYYDLSENERNALPQARILFELDEEIESIHGRMDALREALPIMIATITVALACKLSVALADMHRHDHRESYDLIASVLRYLTAINRPSSAT